MLIRKFLLKIIFISFVLAISSCSNSGTQDISLTFSTEPEGAKVYIDNVYYGQTVKQVGLVPNKNYNLKLVKSGYQTIEHTIKKRFNLRPTSTTKRIRCRLNLLGSVLILPLFYLKENCNDFAQTIYKFDMVRIPMQNDQSSQGNPYFQNSYQSNRPNTEQMILDQYQQNQGAPYVSNTYQQNQVNPYVSNGYQSNRSNSGQQNLNQYSQGQSRSSVSNRYQSAQQNQIELYRPSEYSQLSESSFANEQYVNNSIRNTPSVNRENNYYPTPYRYYDPGQVPRGNGVKTYEQQNEEIGNYQNPQRNYLDGDSVERW